MQTDEPKFIITDEGRKTIVQSIRSFRNTTIYLTPFFIFLNLLMAYGVTYESFSFSLNFWLIFIFASLVCSIITIYFPLNAIRKYNNIVTSFEIKNDKIVMLTFKSKEIKLLDASKFLKSETEFILPKQKSMAICVSFNDKSYFILKSFFNEYFEIQKSFDENIR
jgi:hypothetical protein